MTAVVNAVLNLMVIGIFMPDEVITLYGLTGAALVYGSKWLYSLYAAVPLLISGVFFVLERAKYSSDADDEEQSRLDAFLSGHSRKSDNADIISTWFFAVISWVMTGIALNNIENVGVILPSIIVVMIGAFIIFTSSLYSGGDSCKICGIEAKWLKGNEKAKKHTKRIATMLGVMSGMVGVCLAAWSLVVNNNLPNCIAIAVMLVGAFIVPASYSRSQVKSNS